MSKPKPYTAKSLAGAQRMVRNLVKQKEFLSELLDQYAHERKLMARLADRTPQFFNPLDVMEAEKVRDAILKGSR